MSIENFVTDAEKVISDIRNLMLSSKEFLTEEDYAIVRLKLSVIMDDIYRNILKEKIFSKRPDLDNIT